jgi:D-sedoheptulose 7-phosphate isomerase
VKALEYAKQVGASICGIVGRDGGFTASVADVCVKVPVVNPQSITPHTESFQALIWHLLVSHPNLKVAQMKWEADAPAECPQELATSSGLGKYMTKNQALTRNGP